MFKLDLEKAEVPEIKLPTSIGSSKKQDSSRRTSISALLTMPAPGEQPSLTATREKPTQQRRPSTAKNKEIFFKSETVALNMTANWKTQQWPQTGKGLLSFQSQRKAMPKNAQTTTQLHSSHMLTK